MPQLIPNGTYPITNVFNNLGLKPADNNTGSSIVTGQNDDTDAFKWTFYCINASLNTYTITNKGNTLKAYVPDNSQAGTTVIESNSSQTWTISLVAGTSDTYNISLGSTQTFWSVDNTSAGTPVTLISLLSYPSSDHQKFKLTSGGGSGGLSNGQYRFYNEGAQLKVHPKSDTAGSNIEPKTDDGFTSFQWQLTSTGTNLWTIQNVENNLYVWMDSTLQIPSPAVVNSNTPVQSFTIVAVPRKTGIYTIQTSDQKYLGVGGTPQSVITGSAGTADAFQWHIAP